MTPAGLELVKRFEGYSPRPYLCPAMVWTIGWGTTRYPWGKRVTPLDAHATPDKADSWLEHELMKAELAVIRYTTVWLNEVQRAALASFVYNLGAGAFRASTLRRRLNSGDWEDVPYQLSRWNKAGGRVLRGLVIRRKAEADMWISGTI